MLKKVLMGLMAITIILLLIGCQNDISDEDEEVYVDLAEYLEENREDLIGAIATEGEEVRLELADEVNKFIFTTIIDTIELTDENQTLYSFAFDSSFVHMEELFVGLAKEIRDATGRDYFAIRAVFADVNEEEISSQIFSTLDVAEVVEIDEEPVD